MKTIKTIIGKVKCCLAAVVRRSRGFKYDVADGAACPHCNHGKLYQSFYCTETVSTTSIVFKCNKCGAMFK